MSAVGTARFLAESRRRPNEETGLSPDAQQPIAFVTATQEPAVNRVAGPKKHLDLREVAVPHLQHDRSRDLVLEHIRVAPLFRSLSLPACVEIACAARDRSVSRGETIFYEDDPVESIFLIVSGRIKLTQLSLAGKEVILRLEGPAEVLNPLGLCSSKSHLCSARAIEPSRLLAWEIKTFDAFASRFPQILRNDTNILGERLRLLQHRFRDMATERVPQRVARLLLSLLDQGVEPTRRVYVGLSQEELAHMAGTTAFTISRLLCDWASRGIIQPERKAILVEDIHALIAISQSGDLASS